MITTAIKRVPSPYWTHWRREQAAVPLIVSLVTVVLLALFGLVTAQAQQDPVYYDAIDTDWNACHLQREHPFGPAAGSNLRVVDLAKDPACNTSRLQ